MKRSTRSASRRGLRALSLVLALLCAGLTACGTKTADPADDPAGPGKNTPAAQEASPEDAGTTNAEAGGAENAADAEPAAAAAPTDDPDTDGAGQAAEGVERGPYTETDPTRRLRFREDGEFHILVFSDTHVTGTGASELAKTNIRLLVERENPDLVLFDGDNIWGVKTEDAFQKCAESLYGLLEEKGIPWAHVYGNHDAEGNNLKKEKQQKICESFAHCLSEAGDPSLPGVGNYVLPIYDAKGENPVFNIWMLDSGQYITDAEKAAYLPVRGIFEGFRDSVYDYIRPSQIRWYTETSEQLERAYGHKIPGIMAFHIPLQESYLAWVNRDGTGTWWTGEKREAVCASEINSGLYAALVERGDVRAVVNGHDHVNDYMVDFGGIMLCYCSTVSETGYCDMDMLGARVFVLNESDPWNVETYISYVDERRMIPPAPPADAGPLPSGVIENFDGAAPALDWCGWDNNVSPEAHVEDMIVTIAEGRGYNGTSALGVSRKNFDSSTTGNNAEVRVALAEPGKIGSSKYLRVWMDFTGDTTKIEVRKACFGVVVNGQKYSPYRTDDNDAPSPFWYRAEDSDTWTEMSHGGDGCFGAQQDSPVLGKKGWFAFPLDQMWKRSSLEPLNENSVVTDLYFYYCLNSDTMVNNRIYLDEIAFVEDYTVFEEPVS